MYRLFMGMKDRGLTDVALVVSDDHKKAIQACFPGASRHVPGPFSSQYADACSQG
ncbi:hypothetical protein GF324_13505 [bacterium]|nr:hypothetical protein [bacterium]